MTGWVILVDQPRDLPNAETPHKVITTTEYLARPRLFEVGRPKLVKAAVIASPRVRVGHDRILVERPLGQRPVPLAAEHTAVEVGPAGDGDRPGLGLAHRGPSFSG